VVEVVVGVHNEARRLGEDLPLPSADKSTHNLTGFVDAVVLRLVCRPSVDSIDEADDLSG
jgi:hypothetical protein